jgi:hypothetical protein
MNHSQKVITTVTCINQQYYSYFSVIIIDTYSLLTKFSAS